MLDLETMGKLPTAAITSIGAVRFDPMGDWLGDSFHIHVSLENCLRSGLTADASTILWWIAQSDDARATLVAGQCSAAPLVTALEALAAWMPADAIVWCNGTSFDLPILKHAYNRIGMPEPWACFNECDLRTLKRMNPDLRIERTGTAHNALHDAIHQARLVQHILQFNKDIDA